jgi:hypothetical protein
MDKNIPLSRTPNLNRLLGPGEEIIYTAKLHPFHGLYWLFGALLFAALAWVATLWFALPALGLAVIYALPFINHEVAVTTHRVLLRHGRFVVHTDCVDADHLDHYQLYQHTLGSVFHFGTVILNLWAGRREVRKLPLYTLWHPMTFLEAVTTLNPGFRAK